MRLCDVPESHRLGLPVSSSDAAILGAGVGFGMGIFREGPAGGGGGDAGDAGEGGGGGDGVVGTAGGVEEGGFLSIQSPSLSRDDVFPRRGPSGRERPPPHHPCDTYRPAEEDNEAS